MIPPISLVIIILVLELPLRLGRRRMDSKERIYDVSNIVSRDIIRSRCIYAVVQKSEL